MLQYNFKPIKEALQKDIEQMANRRAFTANQKIHIT